MAPKSMFGELTGNQLTFFFFFQLFIRNMQFSTSTFGILQCHDIYAAIEIGLDCRSLDESHLI